MGSPLTLLFMTANDFFLDLIRRFFAKTPKFHQYVQTVSLVLAGLLKLPDFLNSIGEHIPTAQEPYKTALLAITLTAAFVSQLAVADDSKLKMRINTK